MRESDFGIVPDMGKLTARQQLDAYVNGRIDSEKTAYSAITGKGFSNSLLGRIRAGTPSDFRISQLDKLADALKCEPWQLLCPLSSEAMRAAIEIQKLTDKEARRRAVATVEFKVQEELTLAATPASPPSVPTSPSPSSERPTVK